MNITEITPLAHDTPKPQEASLYARTLIETSLDPLVTIGADGKIMDVNKATELVTGLPRERLIGTDFSDYFTEPDKAREGYQKVFSEGLVRDYPLAIRSSSGAVTDVLYNASLFRNEAGEVQGIFAAARDVTELKRTEQKLREASLYSRTLIETSLDPLVTIGGDGKIMDVNRATEAATGISRERLIGTDFSDYFTEPDRAREGYRKVFSEGLVRDYPLAIKSSSGAVIDVLYNASLFRNEAGEVQGIFAAARDITEKKRADEKLQETLAELKRSNTELEQFAYVASHDLQEPLRIIGSFSQLIERRYGEKLDAEGKEYIDFMVDGASRMQQLINDLLDFSRVATRMKPFALIDFKGVLDRAARNLADQVEQNEAVITHDPLPSVLADDIQLVQVLQNLISNALKFRGKDAPRIHIGAAQRDGAWFFSIRDNGIGIDPKHYERIFIIFQRLHSKKDYSGTGIGLAICKKIIERHGGKIWVESEPGHGSTFHFTMPVKEDPHTNG